MAFLKWRGGNFLNHPLTGSARCRLSSPSRYFVTELCQGIYRAKYVYAVVSNTQAPARIQRHHCGESYALRNAKLKSFAFCRVLS